MEPPATRKPSMAPKFEPVSESLGVRNTTFLNPKQSRFMRWIVLIGFFLVLFGLVYWLFPDSKQAVEPVTESSETLFDRPPIETAQAFTDALDPVERLKWARHPKVVSQHLSHYPAQALTEEVESVRSMLIVHGREFPFVCFEAKFSSGDRRLICVIKTPEGDKVDWDAFARYGSVSWEDVLKGRGGSALVRVFAKPGHYYNYNFQDDQKWSCYELSSPDFEGKLYGYVERDSVTAKIFAEVFLNGSKTKNRLRMSLRIRITPGDIENRMLEITKVAARGWIVGEEDFEKLWSPRIR